MSKKEKLVVSNIKKTIHSIQLKDTPYASLQHLVPSIPHATLTFELHHSSIAFANAIRRCMTNELTLKYLTVDMSDIDITYGSNIVKEVVLKRIESIAIHPSIPLTETFKVSKNNDTTTFMDVNSESILSTSKKNNTSYFTNGITLCTLEAGHYISIDNIHVQTARGKDNGRAALGTIAYEIIDHNMEQSSLISHPSSFRFTVETNGNFNQALYDPIHMTVHALIQRLERIENVLKELKQEQKDQGIYYLIEFNVFKLFIPDESHTIGNLMKRYIYQLDPSIEYVNYRIVHPSKEELFIDIKNHTNPKKICLDAITEIKKDLNQFDTFFMKKNA